MKKKVFWLFCGLLVCSFGHIKSSNKSVKNNNDKEIISLSGDSYENTNPSSLKAAQANEDSDIQSTLIASDGRNDDIRPMAAGVYDKESNKTYAVYMNMTGAGDAYVMTCDHNNNNTWDKGYTAGVGTQDDKHNYPQIVLPDDGRPVIIFGAHNIPLKIAKMDIAGDPSSWTTRTLAKADDGSYPMPIKSRNGDIYVFYRVTVSNVVRPMYYIKSTDNGVTWSDPILAIERVVDVEGFREIYVGMITEEPYRYGVNQRFHFAWTLAGASIPAGNHDWAREGLYHAYFEPATDTYFAADGTSLGSSIDENDMDKYCEIVAPQRDPLREGYMGYDPKLAVSENGDILVWEFHDDGSWEDVVHYFNGSSWQIQAGSGLSVYPKGIDYFNGKHYFIGNSRNNNFQGTSDNGQNFNTDFRYNMVGAQSGVPTITIPIREGHPSARIWSKETTGEPTNVWIGSFTGSGVGVPASLKAGTTKATINEGEITTINVYVCDNVGGGYGRVTDATNAVTLEVVSGNAQITSGNTTAAQGGKASFSIKGGSSNTVFRATSSGLESTYINIYSNSNSTSNPQLEILSYSTAMVTDVFKADFFSPSATNISVQIVNSADQVVAEQTVLAAVGNDNSVSFDVSTLAGGDYTLQLSDNSSIVSCGFSKKELFKDIVLNKSFPNPTPDLFAMEITCSKNMPLPIAVYDEFNQIVMEEEYFVVNGINKVVLDLSNLPSGLYKVTLNYATSNEITTEVTKIE